MFASKFSKADKNQRISLLLNSFQTHLLGDVGYSPSELNEVVKNNYSFGAAYYHGFVLPRLLDEKWGNHILK